MIKHIRRWYQWQKGNRNGRWYKFMVLIGVMQSPSMVWMLLPEEMKEISEEFQNALRGGRG